MIISDLCSKLVCSIKKIKSITQNSNTNESVGETSEQSESTQVSEAVQFKKEDRHVEIIIQKPIYEYAHGKKFKANPQWIVVHYTACINTSAKTMCKAMKNNTSASSHFYIDENDICSAVPEEYIAWHVGNGECKRPEAYKKTSLDELANYKASDWRYDLAAKNHLKWQARGNDFSGNNCSIGVDLCVRKKSSTSKKATDKDWYFTECAIDNTAKTVAYLATKYNISIDHVIRHADATGKLCPQPFAWPPDAGDNQWAEFKSKVMHYISVGVKASFV